MSAVLGEVRVERTGFAAGDRVLPWVARCWVEASFAGLRFAYGESEVEALRALEGLLARESVVSAGEVCAICEGKGYVRYGHDREVDCECVDRV